MAEFVHLHVRSDYSLMDSIARPSAIVSRARELGMSAIAITDHATLAAYPELCRRAGDDLRVIPGVEVPVRVGRATGNIVALATNLQGYRNLLRLIANSACTRPTPAAPIPLDILAEDTTGLVATSGSAGGAIAAALAESRDADATRLAGVLAAAFEPGAFHLALTDHAPRMQVAVVRRDLDEATAELAERLGLPTVLVNDVRFVHATDADTHRIVATGRSSRGESTPGLHDHLDQLYLKSAQEMRAVTPYSEAYARAGEIASWCSLTPEHIRAHPVRLELSPSESADDRLRTLVLMGAKRRWGAPIAEEIAARIEHELEAIVSHGWADRFLLHAELVGFADLAGIVLGPGRGFATSLATCFALEITDVDPLAHGLLAERFLHAAESRNPSLPVDVDADRTGDVFNFLRERFGTGRVALNLAYHTADPASAVIHAGQYLKSDPGTVSAVLDAIDDAEHRWDALDRRRNDLLDQTCTVRPEAGRLAELASEIVGLTDSVTHIEDPWMGASAVIASVSAVEELPIAFDRARGPSCQYSALECELLGHLTVAATGARSLTVLANVLERIRDRYDIDLDVRGIPFDDSRTLQLFQTGQTQGVFGYESRGMRTLLESIDVAYFGHLVAATALFRPRTLDSGHAAEYAARSRHGLGWDRAHPLVAPALEETYDLLLYQEQVMQIAMACGLDGREAYQLMRWLQLARHDELEAIGGRLIAGAIAAGADEETAHDLWARLRRDGRDAFLKAHAVAHATLGFRMAYIKSRFPRDFEDVYMESLGSDSWWHLHDVG